MGQGKEAKLYLGDGHYDIMSPGDHVLCSITGQKILLHNLRYWSVDLQEIYASCDISTKREVELRNKASANETE